MWPLAAPSALPYTPRSQTPRALTRADMEQVRDEFARAAQRALIADFDLLLLHMANGYLLASFLSPLANHRDDAFGGPLEHRMRFPLEVFDTVRTVWPRAKALGVVLTCDDCLSGGLTVAEAVVIAAALKAHGCDLIDVRAGHTLPHAVPVYGRGFLTRTSDRIRNEAGIATLVGGYITTMNEVNTVLAAERADLCLLTPLSGGASRTIKSSSGLTPAGDTHDEASGKSDSSARLARPPDAVRAGKRRRQVR